MSEKATQIADGVLLEYSVEGYTITAADWNSTMQTLKSAINSNAKVLMAVKPGAYITTISGSDFVNRNNDPSAYYYVIPSTVHKVPIPFVTTVFNTAGQQIDNIAQTNFESGDITIHTRRLEDIVLIIQGVSA